MAQCGSHNVQLGAAVRISTSFSLFTYERRCQIVVYAKYFSSLPSKYFISAIRTLDCLLALAVWTLRRLLPWFLLLFIHFAEKYSVQAPNIHLAWHSQSKHSFYTGKPSKTSVLIMFRKHACQTLYQSLVGDSRLVRLIPLHTLTNWRTLSQCIDIVDRHQAFSMCT